MSSPGPERSDRARGARARSRSTGLLVAVLLGTMPLSSEATGPADPESVFPGIGGPDARLRAEPGESWIVELHLGGILLSPGIVTIDNAGNLLLPLSALAEAFELAIDVDPEAARATGFVVHPQRRFELDLPARTLTIAGQARDLASERIVISDDIYVDARTLASWLPVDFDVDRRRLRVDAHSREALPVERRHARERLQRRLRQHRATRSDPARSNAYRWWTPPAMDVSLITRTGRIAEGGGQDWSSQYHVALAGDLLKLRTELLWTGVETDALRLRARMGRRDPDGHLGGALRLREFTFGDVYTPSISMLASGRSGRGFQVSSFPLSHLDELGQLTLEGDLPPGYQVELYREEMLLDFQDSRGDLRYRFENIPTVPGLNVLRLVFYGPRGETREEERRLWADGGLAEPGESRFRLTYNQHDTDTLILGEMGGDERVRGEFRAFGEFEYGLGKALTLAMGSSSIPLPEGRHHYGTLGLRSQIDGHLLHLDAHGSEGGAALGGGWQTRLGPFSVRLTHFELRDFLSERTRSLGGERLRGRTEAALDGRMHSLPLPLTYRVEAGHSRLTSGDFDLDGLLRLSTFLRPVFITHTLRGRLERMADLDNRALDGDLLASYRRGVLGLRGRFLYSILPTRATAISLIGDWSPHYLVTTRLGVTHQFGERTALVASLSRRVGLFVVSAGVELDERGVASASLGLSFGMTPDPWNNQPRWQDPGATQTGAVAARAFLDRNANGRFDGDDQAVSDVGFTARGTRDLRTGEQGTALITRLPVDAPVEVGLDAFTVRNPHWLIPGERERLVLRPGAPAQIDFPIVPVGEIDGWVVQAGAGPVRPVSGISLQLLDTHGAIVDSTRSEIDGFYVFEQVLPGSYRLRVHPAQAERRGLEAPPARSLAISEHEPLASGQRFELRPAGGPGTPLEPRR